MEIGQSATNHLSATIAAPEPGAAKIRAESQTQPLSEDIAFLLRFGIDPHILRRVQCRADWLKIPAAQCLIDQGIISEVNYFSCVAFELGLEFVHDIPADGTPFFDLPDAEALARMARMITVENHSNNAAGYSPRTFYIAPDCLRLEAIKDLLQQTPEMVNRVKVTTLSNNRKSLTKRCEPALLDASINRLAKQYPKLSAKRVVTVTQAISLILLLQLLGLLSLFAEGLVPVLLHLLFSLFYLGCIGLRLFALFHFDPLTRLPVKEGSTFDVSRDATLPKYSVLVALYDEANQINDLVDALCALQWPREKLEILLVCEGDDLSTQTKVTEKLNGISASHIRLISVPASNPRTKPKALNFALPLCTGELVVIYDAEDRPSPLQLREACEAFRQGPVSLACVQAPLVIINNNENLLSRLFAIEYSALFDGLLPALAKYKTPIPLGGTSNHFKRKVLVKIGGWDPYNVTEDADLGIRLARAGCLIDTLKHPTYEEAPADLEVWLKQRTRWFKGWYQTWLLHFRHPFVLIQDLGFIGFLVFHLMMAGMAVSALIHPLLIYFIAAHLIAALNSGFLVVISNPLFVLDIATILLGYITFAALAWDTLPLRGLAYLRRSLWAVPLYWMLLSAAAWRALWHLLRRPHDWEKTPHRLKLSDLH